MFVVYICTSAQKQTHPIPPFHPLSWGRSSLMFIISSPCTYPLSLQKYSCCKVNLALSSWLPILWVISCLTQAAYRFCVFIFDLTHRGSLLFCSLCHSCVPQQLCTKRLVQLRWKNNFEKTEWTIRYFNP